MRYKVRNILGSTALALFMGLTAPAGLYAQTLNIDEVQPQENTGAAAPILTDNAPIPHNDTDFNAPILPDNNMPILDSNIPFPEENEPILPEERKEPLLPESSANVPLSVNNPPLPLSTDTTAPALLPSAHGADDPILLPSPDNGKEPIPDLINVTQDDPAAMGDNILNKIDNNLFSKMSSIEKQSALLSLELRREKIRNEIEAIKAQRKKALEEEQEREEERKRKREEWENEQQRKLLVEQQKLKELENQREMLRQEKIVKAYKETMLQEKQEWIKHNADLYNQISQIENERDSLIEDFKVKLNNLQSEATKAVVSAQTAKSNYDQAINALKTQLSVVQSRLDAELSAKLNKDNPFASIPEEDQVRLNDVYAIMEIVGKGENLAAKLINKNGDRFMVRKGTALQTGHIVDEITETYIRADINGAKDYLYFAAGGILDSEPQKSAVLKGAMEAMAAAEGAEGAVAGNKNTTLNTSQEPSLGEGMFVR